MWVLLSVLGDLLFFCSSLTPSYKLHTGRGRFLFTGVTLVAGT